MLVAVLKSGTWNFVVKWQSLLALITASLLQVGLLVKITNTITIKVLRQKKRCWNMQRPKIATNGFGGMVSKAVPLLLNRRNKQHHGFINYDRLLAVRACFKTLKT